MKLGVISTALASASNLLPRGKPQPQTPPPPNGASPYEFPISQAFQGNDGQWSTFVIRVGTPPQTFFVLPATNGQETWIPYALACVDNLTVSCGQERGVQGFASHPSPGFNENRSLTWVSEGIFNLGMEANLGLVGNGFFGYDTVGFGLGAGSGLEIDNVTVAGFVRPDFYLGYFGLGPKPSNFSDFNTPVTSAMTALAETKKIPSRSFGYTAGAVYKGKEGSTGSLTLGGYDQARFTPNDMTFNFDSDDSKSLTVALQTIRASNTLKGTINVLYNGIFTLIDSAVTAIWLPASVCDTMAAAFGLTYDNNTDFYIVNDTMHAKLEQLNPTLTFSISDTLSDKNKVDITLPYAAFNLQANWPYYNKTQNYFPIRRAQNDTQYVIGRTFLQEAYVIANYEESTFQVAQAVYNDGTKSDIRSISVKPLQNSTEALTKSTPRARGISTGVIVGLSVSLIVVCMAILLCTIFLLRRQRARRASAQSERDNMSSSSTILGPGSPATYKGEKGGENPFDIDSKGKFGSASDEQHPGWHKTELPSDASSHPHQSVVWEDGELVRRKKLNEDGGERRPVKPTVAQELGGCGPASEMEDSQVSYINTPSSGSTMVSPWQGKMYEPKEEVIYEMVGDEPRNPEPAIVTPRPRRSGQQDRWRPPTGFI